MDRFSKSGTTDNALVVPANFVYCLFATMGYNALTTGRQFWLLSFWVHNTHAAETAVVGIYDDADAAVGAAAQQRFSVPIPPGELVMVDFPEPGLGPFLDNCCAATTLGTVAAYHAGCVGYEIGPT